jgi:hypothetical protein
MHGHAFDDVSRRAAGRASRRGSLMALGGAAMAATVAGVPVVQAGNARKKTKRRIRRTCGRQVDACREAILDLCGSGIDCEEDNLERLLLCCDNLSNCQAGASLDCYFSLIRL